MSATSYFSLKFLQLGDSLACNEDGLYSVKGISLQELTSNGELTHKVREKDFEISVEISMIRES